MEHEYSLLGQFSRISRSILLSLFCSLSIGVLAVNGTHIFVLVQIRGVMCHDVLYSG